MSDYFLKKFYSDVCASNWPPIENYNDFLKLSKSIIDECYKDHNFQQRRTQIENQQYWREQSTHAVGYKFRNVIYVPVTKCANTYYTKFFHNQLGWEKINLWEQDWTEVSAFGTLMHPITRMLKAKTQNLTDAYDDNYKKILQLLDNNYLNFINVISITDVHSIPYWLSYGKLLNKINWIPLEIGTDAIKDEIEKYLRSKKIEIVIPRGDKKLNESPKDKIKIFEVLRDNWLLKEVAGDFYLLYAHDLKFYHNLIDTYHKLDETSD
jgi:hypothetical protein